MAKPHIGLPVALTNLSRRGVLLSLGVIAISIAVMPSWPHRWISQLGGYQHFFPVLVFPGVFILLAGLRYRERDARILLIASLVPQRWFYDPLILFLIPKTRRELTFTLGISWIVGIWRWFHNPHSMAQVGLWSVLRLSSDACRRIVSQRQNEFRFLIWMTSIRFGPQCRNS